MLGLQYTLGVPIIVAGLIYLALSKWAKVEDGKIRAVLALMLTSGLIVMFLLVSGLFNYSFW